MTFLDIAARNERDHAEEKERLRTEIERLCAYRDELEDHVDIATGMIAKAGDCSYFDAVQLIADAYYAARQAAVT